MAIRTAEAASIAYGVLEMFLEYRDRHGYDEERAKHAAVSEILQGIDAESEVLEFEQLERSESSERNS